MINFFNDPSELPWEEEENAKDVIHFRDEIVNFIRFEKMFKKLIFYFKKVIEQANEKEQKWHAGHVLRSMYD